jgi:hypothetical protein
MRIKAKRSLHWGCPSLPIELPMICHIIYIFKIRNHNVLDEYVMKPCYHERGKLAKLIRID